MTRILVRPSTAEDVSAVTAIYGWHVRHGTGTFEIDPPTVGDMAQRREGLIGRGLPYLVLEEEGEVCGYAYANQFRPRPAYRFCLEDSVYLAPERAGRGLGKLLLVELLARCEAAGARQVLAVIGDSRNAASVGVHRALGFAHTGTIHAAGWKFERWLDVVLMQRSLGSGIASAPA